MAKKRSSTVQDWAKLGHGANQMWLSRLLVAVLLFGTNCGCNHVVLQRRTVNQASTLLDLQYRQVLDNIAMFMCNH